MLKKFTKPDRGYSFGWGSSSGNRTTRMVSLVDANLVYMSVPLTLNLGGSIKGVGIGSRGI